MATGNPPDQFKFKGFQFPTTTPVPDEVFDVLMHLLTGAEFKVLLYICRRTFGFKKRNDDISLAQMINGIVTRGGKVLDRGTGLSKDSVSRAVKSLEQKGVILRNRNRSTEKGDEPTTYALNFLPVSENLTPPHLKIGHARVLKSDPQQTVVQETVDNSVVVVDALTNSGISKRVAQKLTDAYPEDYLLQKLDLVQWMVATGSSLVGKNPAGYLRRAIEEDYLHPPQYQTAEQRQKDEKTLEAARQRRQEAEEEHRRTKDRLQQRLQAEHPPQPVGEDGLNTESAWSLTLEQLKEQASRSTVEIWLRNTMLLEVTGNTAQVMVPSQFALDWLEKRMYQSIARTLGGVLQREVEVEFVVPESPE